MPRAVDPSLFGNQLPVEHDPLSRIDYRNRQPDFDINDIIAQFETMITDFLFPAIENLTGIDLSAFLPLLNLLELDFSSPTAFLTSLVTNIIALPAVLVQLLSSLIQQLTHPENSDQLQELLTGLISLIASLPTLLIQLATALINSGAGLLGIQSPLNALNLFNIVPTQLLGQLNFSNLGEAFTNLIMDPLFEIGQAFEGLLNWSHDDTTGHVGTTSAQTTADGTLKELLGNLIPVSPGQVLNLGGWAKWAGLTGTGSPVQIAVTGYTQAGDATTQATVASHNTTPPTTDWTHLSGTYTVPANVFSLRTRLVVTNTATAGTVWFDDLSATKSQNIFQRLIAGQDPGQNLTNDIEGLFTGVITNAIGLTNRAGLSDFNDLVQTIEGNVQVGFETIGDILGSFLHGGSILDAGQIGTGQVSDQFVPGLGTIHDVIVNAVGALSGGGFDIGKMFEVLTGQTNSVVSTSSQQVAMHSRLAYAESKLAALPVSLGGTGIGISFGGIVGSTDTDEFERVNPSNLGTEWLTYYSGGAGIVAIPNGHDASFVESGTSDREFLCVRNNPGLLRSLTDYQRVTSVLSSKAQRHQVILAGDWCGHNDVWLRISDATTSLANVTGIRIRWGADGSVSIVRFLSGAATTLKSFGAGTVPVPGPGSALIGEAGDMNGGSIGQRYFRGIVGNNLIIEVTETGTASGFGAAYRRWGMGGRTEGWNVILDSGQESPGALHHWNGMDQVFA